MAIDLSQFHQVFFEESFEGLDIMESALMELNPDDIDSEVINSIFRSAHSIKGGSATFGFSAVAEFTHNLETLLDQVRAGQRGVSGDDVNVYLQSVDCMREMLGILQNDGDGITEHSKTLKAKFSEMLEGKTEAVLASQEIAEGGSDLPIESQSSNNDGPHRWSVSVAPGEHVLKTGNEITRLFRELEELGDVAAITCIPNIPSLKSLDPESLYLSWELELVSDIDDKSLIEEVFEWIADESVISVEPCTAAASSGAEDESLLLAPNVGDSQLQGALNGWQIEFVPRSDMLRTGNDPLRMISALQDLGDVEVVCCTEKLPAMGLLDSEACFLSWQISLVTEDSTKEQVEDVFEWVLDEAKIMITAATFEKHTLQRQSDSNGYISDEVKENRVDPHSDHQTLDGRILDAKSQSSQDQSSQDQSSQDQNSKNQNSKNEETQHNSGKSRVIHNERVVANGSSSSGTVSESKSTPIATSIATPTPTPIHTPKEAPKEAPKETPEVPILAQASAAMATPLDGKKPVNKSQPKANVESSSIRVGIDKVDNLINMVGELVITQSMLGQLGNEFELDRVPKLLEGLSQLEQNTRELQESVMRIRMLPISFAFSRFPRMVRDLSQTLDKSICLKMLGEQTELDKTVMEKIGDPLVHLVRNAIDHGIESRKDRVANGKPEEGNITLNAYHQGGNVVIEISDDGKGLDREKLVAKALERGLVSAQEKEALTNEQVYDLIFQPGFSTAETVSDVSGRGVGMDVVRRNIQALNGNVEIKSEKGKGSKITIRLPLTLAILDGQLVRVGADTYIFPLVSIVESLQIKREFISHVAGGCSVFKLRDDYVPIIELYKTFSIQPDSIELDQSLLVVVEFEGEKVGIVVDELQAQQQVVIKSLEQNYKRIDGISGATILGDGTVALILDIGGIVKLAGEKFVEGKTKMAVTPASRMSTITSVAI